MKKNEFYFTSSQEKSKIRGVEWLPEGEPKAVLQITHGAEEQVRCCEELAQYFSGQGFVVVRSVGCSAGIRSRGQEEIHACLKMVKKKYPDVPYLLLGLSQGAVTVYSFVETYPEAVEGVVLADAGQQQQSLHKEIPVLQVSGVENNCHEAFRYIYRWTEERLDEMLYRAAKKQ